MLIYAKHLLVATVGADIREIFVGRWVLIFTGCFIYFVWVPIIPILRYVKDCQVQYLELHELCIDVLVYVRVRINIHNCAQSDLECSTGK